MSEGEGAKETKKEQEKLGLRGGRKAASLQQVLEGLVRGVVGN